MKGLGQEDEIDQIILWPSVHIFWSRPAKEAVVLWMSLFDVHANSIVIYPICVRYRNSILVHNYHARAVQGIQ